MVMVALLIFVMLASLFQPSKQFLGTRLLQRVQRPLVWRGCQSAPADPLASHLEEIQRLRGSPELADRLQHIASKHPGIELDMSLYRSLFSFPLDAFQEDGLTALIAGKNAIVMTPTGSGKTVVGELAIYYALMLGQRIVYTTPLKALSNQKFGDFKKKYGADRVGLLTGDISINPDAQICVMTTEVLRNVLYDPSRENRLKNVFMVCFDEFHYMNDPDRGTVWEECVISCPLHIRMLALSATMGNVEDIQAWFTAVHGPTALIRSEHRPVPLKYFYAMKDGIFPFFKDPDAGPGAPAGIVNTKINPLILKTDDPYHGRGRENEKLAANGHANTKVASYLSVVQQLKLKQKLPAIIFIFSRKGCDDNAKLLVKRKVNLLTPAEANDVNLALMDFNKNNPEIPLNKDYVRMLQMGIGVHHAGMIAVWKALVEDLFNANRIKVLFATETLAAGVNMPARTTVISTMSKKIGSELAMLKPSQLLQMAGRAGRRGKDVEGYVVIMKNKYDPVRAAHGILVSKLDGIASHFRASYSLTVNLLNTKTHSECKDLIGKGFGSYLMQKKSLKHSEHEGDNSEEAQMHRKRILKYGLNSCRKLQRMHFRLEKERRSLEFLQEDIARKELEIVQSLAEYMPPGSGLMLRDGKRAFLLGPVDFQFAGDNSTNSADQYAVITQQGEVLAVSTYHIKVFTDPSDSVPQQTAEDLLDLLGKSQWAPMTMPSVDATAFVSDVNKDSIRSIGLDQRTLQAYEEIIGHQFAFSIHSTIPGAILKQQSHVRGLESEYNSHPIVSSGDVDGVLESFAFVSQFGDAYAFVHNGPEPQNKEETPKSFREMAAWVKFQNVSLMLEEFGAIDKETKEVTDFGHMVSSFTTDNDLWTSLIVSKADLLNKLDYMELGGLFAALNLDAHRATNALFNVESTPRMKMALSALEDSFNEMESAQDRLQVNFPVVLTPDICGVAHMWATGCSWRDLCAATSLDQGDLCRTLRRTVEVLQQIPIAYHVDHKVVEKARRAIRAMDRFPVAELDESIHEDLLLAESDEQQAEEAQQMASSVEEDDDEDEDEDDETEEGEQEEEEEEEEDDVEAIDELEVDEEADIVDDDDDDTELEDSDQVISVDVDSAINLFSETRRVRVVNKKTLSKAAEVALMKDLAQSTSRFAERKRQRNDTLDAETVSEQQNLRLESEVDFDAFEARGKKWQGKDKSRNRKFKDRDERWSKLKPKEYHNK